MAKKRKKELVWLPTFLPSCLDCRSDLYVSDAELMVVGPERVWFGDEIAFCADCGRNYAPLEYLFELVEDEGWSITQIKHFQINRRMLKSGVWMGPERDITPWDTFLEQIAEREARLNRPAPTPAEVRGTERVAETWELWAAPCGWIVEDETRPALAYFFLVVDPDGLVRTAHVHQGLPTNIEPFVEAVYRAVVHSDIKQPGRPHAILIDHPEYAKTLGDALQSVGIPVRSAPTPLARKAGESVQQQMNPEQRAPYFVAYDTPQVLDFFRAARAFFRLEPWTRFSGNKYIGVQIDDGPWRYLNIMGQMGEEMGVSLFNDWLHLCRFIHNPSNPFADLIQTAMMEGLMPGSGLLSPDEAALVQDLMDEELIRDVLGEFHSSPLEAAGTLESISLSPLHLLHPQDGALLLQLGIKPFAQHLYPFPQRFIASGPAPPTIPLPHYTLLMQGLTDILKKRKARQITSIKKTLTIDDHTLTFRYPATGMESVTGPPESYHIIIEGVDLEGVRNPIPKGTRFEIEAPGDLTIYRLFRALNQHELHPIQLTQEEHALWHISGRKGDPGPRVFQLIGLDDLGIDSGFDLDFPVQIMRRLGPPVTELAIRKIS